MSTDVPNPDPDESNGTEGVERIADPDQYSHRRRLKQLHDAKERVRETKSLAVRRETMDREFTRTRRDRVVAEDVVDYIADLASVLKKNERELYEEFRNETLSGNQIETTIGRYLRTRGTDPNNGNEPYQYSVSMQAWQICNDYFEAVAGAEFEQRDANPDQNPVDPAGRFNDS